MPGSPRTLEPIESAYAPPPREELERRLHECTDELAAARREIEAVAYSVSHDLRAPLRLIHAHAQMLREDMTPEAAGESQLHVEQIERGARHLSALIDGILTYSRLGQVEINREPLRLSELVRDAIESLQSSALPRRDVEWRIGELPVVSCDRALMLQALSVLLSNALKYAAPGARTSIEVGADPAQPSCIFVRDNGVGFDMRYAGKLFGLFQRMHRQNEFEGVGIGLALARRIIERHGGKIWAEGKVGEGATFRFTLPA